MTRKDPPHRDEVPDDRPRLGDPDYVGRGHPPKEHQFKKGKSGNPNGRPPGRHRHETRMRKFLGRKVTLSDGRTLCPEELIVASLQKAVAKGDTRAIQIYIESLQRYCKPKGDDERALDPAQKRRMIEAARRLAPEDDEPPAGEAQEDDDQRDGEEGR